MKKILSVLLCFLILMNLFGFLATTASAATVTLLSEGFESGNGQTLPDGWAEEDVNYTEGDWSIASNGSNPNKITAKSGLNAAMFNSYSAYYGRTTRLYMTSGINLSNSTSNTLKFWMYHDTGFAGDDTIQVEVSTNSGITWTTVGTAIKRNNGFNKWTEHSVNLDAYIGYTNLRIAFLATSQRGNNMFLDEVSLSGTLINVPVTRVSLNKSSTSLVVGGTEQLTATIAPSDATNKNVTWTVLNQNPSNVVSISASGTIYAMSPGTAVVRATSASDPLQYAECSVTVTSVPVTGVSLNKSSTNLFVGGTEQLTATITPSNATNKSVTWSTRNSSTGNVINISPSGLITAKNPGTIVVRATSDSDPLLYAECTVTVSSVSVTGISLNKASTNLLLNETEQLTATIAPSNATNQNVTWSIVNSSNAATVSSTGRITGINPGTAVVRATSVSDPLQYAECIVTVTSMSVTGISLNKSATNLLVGETEQLTATIAPSNATNKNVTWSIMNSSNAATVSSTGLITAINPGTAVVRATSVSDPLINADCTVTVNIPAPTTTIINEGFESGNDQALPLGWGELDTYGTSGDWSFVTSGKSPVISPRTGSKMATFNSYSASSGSKTRLYTTSGISLGHEPGNTLKFWMYHDTGYSSYGDNIQVEVSTDNGATWTGLGSAVKRYDGSTGWKEHTVSLDSYMASKDLRIAFLATSQYGNNMHLDDVTVNRTEIANISLDKASISLNPNDMEQLTATITPSDVANKNIVWSVVSQNPGNVATVSPTGLVTAVNPGSAVVRAASALDPAIYAECVVTVTSVSVASVSLNKTSADLFVGGTEQLTATITPSDATNKNVTWSIVNSSNVATVSSTGLITAIHSGTAVVRAASISDPLQYAECTVNITEVSVASVSLNKSSAILYVNGTQQLTATVAPSNATSQNVIWTVEGQNASNIATVSSAGLVTAISPGVVTVKATSAADPEKYAECSVRVQNIVVDIKDSTVIMAGRYEHLKVTVLPAGGNNTVTWSVVSQSGPDVVGAHAFYDGTGLVSALNEGTAVVRATSVADPSVYADCAVTVAAPGWTPQSSGANEHLTSIVYGGGQYVAVGDQGTVVTSPDGTTWTAQPSGTTFNLCGVAYGNGKYVAVTYCGLVFTSTDGISWTRQTTSTNRDLYSITFGNGIFVAAGDWGTVITSSDGITWTTQSTGTTNDIYGIAYGNGMFVAAILQSSEIISSVDGVVWSAPAPGITGWLYSATFSDGIFIVVNEGNKMYTSIDGISWTSIPTGLNFEVKGVSYGNGEYVLVGTLGYWSDSVIATSPDGLSWDVQVVGTPIQSRNGMIWWSGSQLLDVTYANGKFVTVGSNGDILTKP